MFLCIAHMLEIEKVTLSLIIHLFIGYFFFFLVIPLRLSVSLRRGTDGCARARYSPGWVSSILEAPICLDLISHTRGETTDHEMKKSTERTLAKTCN